MRINNHSVEAPNNVEMKVNGYRTKSSGRVNINNLMSKVRANHKRKKKENLVFVGLIGSIVVITGIIASL
jgi:type II secretory pathway component PulK|tara:strand:+ start:574 stop:783 length:210 start_codon:yes stop_codon:yes gene_type:complete